MELNDNLSKFAAVNFSGSGWVPSPSAGVERVMLERVNDGETRATTVVKFQPQSNFPHHIHTGGEEFLVLDGVFSDASGDFERGFYVRNPIGSQHAPWSQTGSIIFVKLGQIDPDDKDYVRLDTNGADWSHYPDQGIDTLQLHRFGNECTQLIQLKNGSTYTIDKAQSGLEIFLVMGQVKVEGKILKQRDWLRYPSSSQVEIIGLERSTLYIKTGHINHNAAPQ